MGGSDFFSHGVVKKVLPAVMLGVVAYAGLFLFADARNLVTYVKYVTLGRLSVALVLVLVSFAFRALRWHYYLQRIDAKVGLWEGLPVFLIGFAASATPGKLAEIVKSLLLKEKWDVPVARSGPVVAAERVTDLVGVLLLGGAGLLTVPRAGIPALIAFAGAFGLLLLCTARPIGELAIRLLSKVRAIRERQEKLLLAYASFLSVVRGVPLLVAMTLSLAAWGTMALCLWVITSAFPDAGISIPKAMVATCAPLLAGALALVPGGLGATEASMAGVLMFLGGAGMSRGMAVAVMVIFRLLTFWFAVGLGLSATVAWSRNLRRIFATPDGVRAAEAAVPPAEVP